ncbi:MAG: O-antigen ligase family protein [Acidobacteriota bacterium]
MKKKGLRHKKGRRKQKEGVRRWGADDVLRLLAAAFFLALPFVISLDGLDKFRLPKQVFASLLIILIGAVYLLSRKPVVRWRPGSWEFLLGVLAAYAGIQVFFSRHPALSLEAFFALCYFAVLLLVLKEIATPDYLRWLWLGIGAVGAVSAAFTVLQYFGLFPEMVGAGGQVISGRLNPAGLIGEVQSGAMLFGLASLMLLGWVMACDRPAWRMTALALLAVNVTGMVFTRTLTALAAFGLTMLLWLAFHHWWHFRSARRFRRELAVLWGLLAVGLAGGAFAAQQSGLVDRIQQVTAQMRRGDWSVATAGRQPVYRIAWEMIREQPLLGAGLNTFGVDFFHYRTETEMGRRQDLVDQPGAFRQVHNEYLQVWLELGLPGLILFLALLVIPAWRAVGQVRQGEDPKKAYWLALHCLAVLFILVECLTFFPFQLTLSGALIVLVFAGLRASQSETSLPREEGLQARSWLVKAALVGVGGLFLAYSQVQVWRANERMGSAEQFLLGAYNQQTRNLPIQRVAARKALDLAERAGQLCPSCYRTDDLRGSALLLLGRYSEAVESYSRAASVIPSAEIYTNLGIAHFQNRNSEKARQSIETALRYRPHYQKAQQALRLLDQP